MKRIILILCISLLACASALAGGIGNAKDLQAFIEACNKGESILPWADVDSTVYLSADIDLAKVRKLPQVLEWNGKFDGRGFKLMNWKPSYGGLFKVIAKGGIVSGIVIDKSCEMKISSSGDEFKVAFIANHNNGVVKDCINCGTITHKCDYSLGPVFVGGIVGYNRFSIINCRNEGKISSDTSGDPNEKVFLSVGGISGGSGGKGISGCVIAHCENNGEINGISNLVSLFTGGITGTAGKNSIKYCINRGTVTADILEAEDGTTKGVARAGGIAAQTKADILRCCNYGDIKTKGSCGGNAGGIVGMPHDALVIAECINRGSVTTIGEMPSNTGGIAGNIGRPVHIRECINFGTVRFDGVSSRARSTAGGIVGNIYTVKGATAGAYVRNCMNHGKVHASAGGNKYDSGNRNSIHSAGIVAYADTRPEILAFIKDCSNDGEISGAGCVGNIVGDAIAFRTGGSLPDVYASSAQVGTDGATIFGKVSAPDGTPLKGIVVTDGLQCVKTGEDGSYSMVSDLSKVRFVYLSIPATASAPLRENVPQFFRRIPREVSAVSADFVLEPHELQKDYTVMMIADPQVRPYGMDESMEMWASRVAPDAEAFRASQALPVYSINLGDLVYNYMNAWDDYMDAAAQVNCPVFNVIGNHDYDQANLYETSQGDVYFETYVGPTHYSFDLGELHFIVMNNILYDRATPNDKYYYGLDDETLAWLKADLSYVPKDKVIVTCTHHNLFKTPASSPNGSHNYYSKHYADYLALLKPYKAIYAWNGHNHQNFYYNYEGKDTRHGSPNIQCISVARCTGALRFNREIADHGEPQGYMVLNVRGEKLDWYYKGIGYGKDYQMKAYPPSRTTDGSVKVNIWNWSEGWSTPEWYEGGVKVADMELTPGVDPDYYDLFQTITNQTTRKYCKPSTESQIFTVQPSPGATQGEVKVTDMFGNQYSLSVNLQQ